MHSALRELDDLTIASRDLRSKKGFTLTMIVHNEMHFLPVFLDHYRALGVARFVILDDASDDGTTDFLSKQPDVMVLKSCRRFGETIPAEQAKSLRLENQRFCLVWRTLLLEKFCSDQWSLHLDADEFVDLPDGLLLSELAETLSNSAGRVVWAVMLDMYPNTLTELDAMGGDGTLNPDRAWYFDGRQHLSLRADAEPKLVYAGCRARLLQRYNLHRKTGLVDKYVRRPLRLKPRPFNAIRKPVLLNWRAGAVFESNHRVSMETLAPYLLPIRHYKFSGHIYGRIVQAIARGQHYRSGGDYKELRNIIEAMQSTGDGFAGPTTTKYEGFEDFRRTGNAFGFD